MARKAQKIIGEAVDHDGIVRVLRQRKAEIDLSDAVLDDLSGLSPGHSSKFLTGARGLGKLTIAPLLAALALRIVPVEGPEAAKSISAHRERRRDNAANRDNGRVSRYAVARARPVVMTELARKPPWPAGRARRRSSAGRIPN